MRTRVSFPEALAAVEELSIEDLVIGDGPEIQSPSEIVTIHYRGTLLDGHPFDSSYARGAPIVASLDSLIRGWTQIDLVSGYGTTYQADYLCQGESDDMQ